jgi:hypothetical protein
MKQITTIFNTTKITINKYEKSDEAAILEPLWVWKVACILNEKKTSIA